jgi:hypothetical protein
MKHFNATTTLTFTLLALAGCGGSDDSGEVTTGLPASQALSDVTVEDATRGCEHMKGAIETRFNPTTMKPKVCTMVAVQLSTTESACTSLRDQCLQQDSSASGGDPSDEASFADQLDCSGTSVNQWDGCAATVGEMETCLNDMLDAVDVMLNTYTCKDAGKVEGDLEFSEPATPSSCQSLQTKCPNLDMF